MIFNNIQICISQRQVDDNLVDIEIHRKQFAQENGINFSTVAIPNQVHSNITQWIDKPGIYQNTDGLITNNNEIVLSLQVADCVPVFIYDEVAGVKALIHSGWRGTKDEIVLNTINQMIKFGCKLKNLQIHFGPSICQNCYEVEWDVAQYFDKGSLIQKNTKKWQLDVQNEIKLQLMSNGILEEQISASGLCTYENPQCCSFRRDNERSGRMIIFMGKL